MLECTEQDARLDTLPYRDNIPHVQILGHNRRQCKDWLEVNVQWGLFSGFITGMLVADMQHGRSVNWSRRFRCGRKYALLMGGLSLPWTYLVCPVCQWPNRGEMQIVPWEQRYKNYVDKKYNLFEDADREFYNTLTSDERIAELKKELEKVEKRKIKIVKDSVEEFTTTGKTTLMHS
mmetsp:Transcript_12320/g.15696  ORF Transcript_12320/g.15696 Transcript_12320/m.15696 type:complete len:177 (+) Transcript_12320:80-610(+)